MVCCSGGSVIGYVDFAKLSMGLSSPLKHGLASLVMRLCDLVCVAHLVFSLTFNRGKVLLIVYVDDIIITGDEQRGIDDQKNFLT